MAKAGLNINVNNSQPLHFYKRLSEWGNKTQVNSTSISTRLEPATCVEAEPFALQVLDDSMQPEFRKGCIILIDPTGRVSDGCFVLARPGDSSTRGDTASDSEAGSLESLLFRQLLLLPDGEWALNPLNPNYQPAEHLKCTVNEIVGVIVQRSGVRRRYHKRYDN